MIYIVLGTDKSGTSMLSSILHESGISMGDDLFVNPNLSYKHYEDKSLITLNNLIMDKYKLSRYNPFFTTDNINSFFRLKSANKFLPLMYYVKERNSNNNDWGMKDPRFVSTFWYWKKHLDSMDLDFKVISIYRKPMSNIVRQSKCEKWNMNKTLQWWNYNLSQIRYILNNANKKYILVEYDYLIDTQNIKPLETFVDKKLKLTINKKQRNNRNDKIPDCCKNTWKLMKKMDNYA